VQKDQAVATKTENQRIAAEAKELRELLDHFGLRLHGFDPGVTALFKEDQPANRPHLGGAGRGFCGEPITFSSIEWAWLKPLLEELRDRRRLSN